ncbi:MAG TPA: ATP synthase F0 subunit C [Blastocatellia bacterium]|nr:ATP synthase F0 subunit C [Blastocatellia bacterium]
MNKLVKAVPGALAMLLSAAPVFAQNQVGDKGYGYIAAVVGFAIAAGLAALGQGRVAGSACEGAARNPGAAGRIQVLMILGLAFIETLVIFTLLIVFLKVPNP